jgi:hypothetical protein
MTDKLVTTQQLRHHLDALGVETEIDLPQQRIYVVAVVINETRILVDKASKDVQNKS